MLFWCWCVFFDDKIKTLRNDIYIMFNIYKDLILVFVCI